MKGPGSTPTAAGPPTLAEIHADRPPLTRPGVRSYHQLTEQEGGPPNERITERTCIDTEETS